MPSGVVGTAGVGPGAEETPERRGSTSSEGSAAGSSVHSRSMSAESTEYSARTRITKATPPKPAANPLQFIKVGPCDLYRSAQEQLRRSEEVKKTKEVKKEEQEDWQSNLDNWKSSRRKRVEHIIERCVEVKRLEEEDHERKRRRSKTFNEMMEDRAGRRNSRAPLPIYCEEDNNDLSDLGIGTSSASGKSSLSEDCDNHSLASDGMDLEKNHSDLDNMSSCEIGLRKLGSSANEYDTCTTATISSPEPEEYTYEGAIQSYKSRVISRTQSSDVLASKTNGTNYNMKEKSPEIFTNGSANLRRPSLGNKIENKLSSFEQRRASNVDLTSTESGKKPLPKVDILKRRELFEKESSPESNGVAPKTVTPRTGNFTNSKSIKERLSNLEKLTEDAITTSKNANRLPAEVTSIKNRLSILEKHTSEADKVQVKLSNGSLNKAPSVKDRLSSLKSQKSQEKVPNNSLLSAGMTQTIKERLSNLDSACNKEFASSPEREFDLKIKMNSFDDSEFREDSSFDSHQTNDSSERNSSPESGLYDSKRFHRSLDSLDTDDNMPAEKFERVQSSDDLCGEAGTGADTDREDSGIHTGDVSCAVSQADEPTENLSLTLLGTSANSQDTVIQAESFMSDSPQPELDDLSGKEEYYQAVSHASAVAEDDPPTLDDNTEIFFDREEEDTVKSLEPDTSVLEALDIAFDAIDSEELQITQTEKMAEICDTPTVNQKPKPAIEEPIIAAYNVTPVETIQPVKTVSITPDVKPAQMPIPLYENVEILYSNGGLGGVTNDLMGFSLGPSANAMEPPKEKPPPPPVDDDDLSNAPLKRLNSTKRIKKEIRNKRSSFLGIEGMDDDSYLDPELKLAPRPDITSFLQEESRVEKMLYRKSLYYDSDSNLGESRDSGVELDRGQSDDTWSNKQPSPDTLSEQHSRQGSEPFTNTSVTSEEEDLTKKERIGLDENDGIQQFVKANTFTEQHDTMGQQLTSKLRKLEQEKMVLENHRSSDDDKSRVDEENRIRSLEEQIREQQKKDLMGRCDDSYDDGHSEEVLRVERELLQLEQEELKRQRDSLMFRESQARRLSGRSLQDINMAQSFQPPVTKEPVYSYAPPIPAGVNYRQSMPDLAMKQTELVAYASSNAPKNAPAIIKRLPPPIPPAKPNRTAEMQERDINVRSSRMPSAEYSNIERESGVILRQKPSSNGVTASNGLPHHQMSRHTLQALSAAPRSRLIPSADWLQPKRRSEPPQNYNYNQHWLIQEAEQRRIDQLRSNIKKQSQAGAPSLGARPKHLPDAVIQTLTQRVQNMGGGNRVPPPPPVPPPAPPTQSCSPPSVVNATSESPEKMLSVSGKKKCSHCGEELGRGAAMIIESLRLFYHLSCFQCCVCGVRLGDGKLGADVRVRHHQLHCHNCYSSDDGVKFSCV